MMRLSPKIEKYILEHSQQEDPLLHRLYRESNLKQVNGRMCSGPMQGAILILLSKLIAPSAILEVGTFTGYSALCLAKGLKEGGVLHTIEINDELASFAAPYFEASGMGNRIIQHVGDAAEVIGRLEGPFDLVFLDADKRHYLNHYEAILPKVNSGGVIIADNTLWDGKVAGPVDPKDEQTLEICRFNDFVTTDPRVEVTLLPVRDGMTILRKL